MFSITRTTYNAVSVHGSRRPRYNGAAVYSETCVRKPPLRLTLLVAMARWLSYKGTCHVFCKQNYKTCTFIRQTPILHQSLSKVSRKSGCLTQVSLYSWQIQYANSLKNMIRFSGLKRSLEGHLRVICIH